MPSLVHKGRDFSFDLENGLDSHIDDFILRLANACHGLVEAKCSYLIRFSTEFDEYQCHNLDGTPTSPFWEENQSQTIVTICLEALKKGHENQVTLDSSQPLKDLTSKKTDYPSNEADAMDSGTKQLVISPMSNRDCLIALVDRENTVLLSDFVRNAFNIRRLEQTVAEKETELQEKTTGKLQSEQVIKMVKGLQDRIILKEHAFCLANEMCLFLGVDRVTVFDVNNKSATALAFSGQPKHNPRANSVRSAEQLVARVAPTQNDFFFTGQFDELPPQIARSIQQHLDQSFSNSLAILPLVEIVEPVYPSEDESMQESIRAGAASSRRTIGALLVENFEDVIDVRFLEQRWEITQELVTNEFTKSKKYDSIFLVRLLNQLGRFAAFYRGQTKRKAMLITTACLTMLMAALLIPCPFKIRCEGKVVVKGAKEIYAPVEGNVSKNFAADGRLFHAGEPMLILKDDDLNKQIIRLQGELYAARIEIESLESEAVKLSILARTTEKHEVIGKQPDAWARYSQMEAQVRDLELRLESLLSQRERLIIRAPFDGYVSGWKSKLRYAQGMRVDGTMALFTLLPANSQAQIELRVPEQRSGYVQSAFLLASENGTQVPVHFRISTKPETRFQGSIDSINQAIEYDQDIGAAMPIIVSSAEALFADQIRPGASVIGKVTCGQSSFAYAKCYEAIDWCQAKWFELTW